MAGGLTHHRSNVDKYHPGYFGKVGMRHFHRLGNHYWQPTVNLDKVYIYIYTILISSLSVGFVRNRPR